MKTPNYIVRIPEPCHEDWNRMLPDEKGKFCNSCNKSVFDFSTKTDAEIKNILLEQKDQKVCGHFRKSQINRPLNIRVNIHHLPINMSITKVFAVALFLVFGTFLFSCTDKNGQKVNSIEVIGDDENKIILGNLSLPLFTNEIIQQNNKTINSFTTDVKSITSESWVEGALKIEEVPIDYATDSINLEEVTVVEYLDPIIDNDVMSGKVSVTTGAVSFTTYPSDIESTSQNEIDSIFIKADKTINNIEIINTSKELSIFPNPSSGEFTIKYQVKKRANVLLEVDDIKGVFIKTLVDIFNQYDGNYQIPVSLNELPNGIYLISLIMDDKKSVERVVIKK